MTGPDDSWADAPFSALDTVTMTDPAGNIIGLPWARNAPDRLLRDPVYPLTGAMLADLEAAGQLDRPQPFANRAARRRAARRRQ